MIYMGYRKARPQRRGCDASRPSKGVCQIVSCHTSALRYTDAKIRTNVLYTLFGFIIDKVGPYLSSRFRLFSKPPLKWCKGAMMPTGQGTKERIAKAFKELVIATPPQQRVTVTSLICCLRIDRKTFYNHFEDIDMLIRYIFRSSLRDMLDDECFSGYRKVYPSPQLLDQFEDMPFYVRIAGPERALDQGLYFKAFGYMLQEDREYYRRILQSPSYKSLFDYIINLYTPAIYDDIIWLLDGRELSEVATRFLAEYHTLGIFGRVSFHYTKTNQFMLQDELEPFWNYAHLILKHTLDALFSEGGEGDVFTHSIPLYERYGS